MNAPQTPEAGTPETDQFIKDMHVRHQAQGLDDFSHYYHASGELAKHARSLEARLIAANLRCTNTELKLEVACFDRDTYKRHMEQSTAHAARGWAKADELGASLRIAESALEARPLELKAMDEELWRMQQAAISTAALQNTRHSEPPLPKDHPYWTPSYQDTLDAVGREITERERAEKAESALKDARGEAMADTERMKWLENAEFIAILTGQQMFRIDGNRVKAVIDAALAQRGRA